MYNWKALNLATAQLITIFAKKTKLNSTVIAKNKCANIFMNIQNVLKKYTVNHQRPHCQRVINKFIST